MASLERRREIYKKYHDSPKGQLNKRKGILKKYGLTLDQYSILLETQQYVCAVCKRAETQMYRGTLKSLSVDHCHRTGRVRGLLCTDCNTALGKLQDSVHVLKNMINYLER